MIVNDAGIIWHKNHKIDWSIYKKTKSGNQSKFSASSVMYLNYFIDKSNGQCALNITAIFNQNNSWVKENDMSEALLNHERCHFDIEEIAARLFRKAVSDKLKQNKCDINFEKLKAKYTKWATRMQKKYDKETNYSRNLKGQERWQTEVITEMLEDLKYFDSFKIDYTNCGCN